MPVELPDLEITPVHRSDESGTTENFVEYLSAAAGTVWTDEVSGDWPAGLPVAGEAAQGTSGVVEAVSSGNGTIGYADASRAGDLGTIAVKVGDDYVPFDCPGQVELYTHHTSLRNVVYRLQKLGYRVRRRPMAFKTVGMAVP